MLKCECKKPMKHRVCKEEYVQNPTICAYKRDKDCEIGECLKDCTCAKNLVNDLVVTCDKIEDTPETTSIESVDKKSHYLPYDFFPSSDMDVFTSIYFWYFSFHCYYIKQQPLIQCLTPY